MTNSPVRAILGMDGHPAARKVQTSGYSTIHTAIARYATMSRLGNGWGNMRLFLRAGGASLARRLLRLRTDVWMDGRLGWWRASHLVRDEGVAGSNPATPTST